MDNFGKLLRAAREQKNLSLEDTARQTSISIQYITALESENIKIFPGVPYAAGFLRNYSEFLELDSKRMISLLRAKIIQEQDPPIELYARRRPAYLIPLILLLIFVFLSGAGFGLWFFFLRHTQESVPATTTLNTNGGTTYDLTNARFQRRLYAGDMLVVPHPNGDITLAVTGTLGSLSLQTPIGVQFIELGEERELDIDGNAGGELIVFVSDVSRTDASRGAEVTVLIKTEAGIESALSRNSFSIFDDHRGPYPFSVNVSFRAACDVLRYELDGNTRVENFYANGASFTVSANNRMRFWISNNSAVKMEIVSGSKTYDLDAYTTRLGRVGAVFDIRWVPQGGTNHLRVIEVD